MEKNPTKPSSIFYENEYCPHIFNTFPNSYLTSQFEKIKIQNEIQSKEPKEIKFRNLFLFSNPSFSYKYFPYNQQNNLMDSYLLNNFSLDWIVLNNPQNLSFSSINRDGCIFTLNFNDDGTKMASSNHNHSIEIWDLDKKKLLKNLKDHQEIVTGIEYFHNNLNDDFLTCSLDKTIKLWKNYKCVHTFIEHSDWVRCISVSNDNKYFLSGCVSAVIKLWDLNSQRVLFSITNNNLNPESLSTVNSLSFMKKNENLFLTGLRSGQVKIFDKRIPIGNNSLGVIQEFKAHKNKLNSVKFNNSENYLLSSGRDSILRLWDMRKLPSINDSLEESSQKSINEYKGHKCVGYNIDCNFFSKEKYIITGSEDSHIYFYDTNSSKIAQKLSCHQKCINLVRPIPKSFSFAYTGLEDISIFIWNTNKNITRTFEQRYADKYNKIVIFDNEENDEDDFDKFQETENSQQLCSKMVEDIMAECGDMILKIFHTHNLTYSNGINFENLLEIIQKSKDEESIKILNMINEKFMNKLMENFVNGMKQPQRKKDNKVKSEEKKIVKKKEVKCLKCLKEKVSNVEVLPKENEFDFSLLNLPNLYNFNEDFEKEIELKKKEKEKENENEKVNEENQNEEKENENGNKNQNKNTIKSLYDESNLNLKENAYLLKKLI